MLLIVWLKKRERLQKEREPKKPIYSLPQREGFQTSTTGSFYLDRYAGSLATYRGSYKSQLDNSTGNKYGEWVPTLLDSYYDKYEQDDLLAMSNMAARLKDLNPETLKIPEYGSSLGYFDSEATKIPWDADNKTYNQSDIVWGTVSEQASRSIFLKTWIQELASRSNNMEPCGEFTAYYCYKSPLFPITVYDPKQALALQIGENLAQSVGDVMQSKGEVLFSGLSNRMSDYLDKSPVKNTFATRLEQNRTSISKLFGITPSVPLEKVPTTRVQAGPHLGFAAGERKITGLMRKMENGLKTRMKSALKLNMSAFLANSRTILAIVNGTAAVATATTLGLTILTPFTMGLGAIASVAATALAAGAIAVAAFVDFFFGIFAMVLMALEAILVPIVTTMFSPGGVCPPGTQRFSSWINNAEARTLISSYIPIGSLIELFDPFVCWSPDARVHLMTPPKIPPFMADATLSLRFRPDWIAGSAPNVPRVRVLSQVKDPLPPNYVLINNSDLVNSQNKNELISYAQSVTGNSGSLEIAVEVCATGTTPSTDGHSCVSTVTNTDVMQPTMSACPANNADDGFNCWRTAVGTNCTGGKVKIVTGNTWSDSTGYLRAEVEDLICDGVTIPPGATNNSNITRWYNDRVTCQPDYEKDTGGLLCYRKCPAGYRRIGAVCQSTVSTYARGYKLPTYSSYYDQPYTPETINTLGDVKIPYCDFSKPVMLDKMAKFYYNNSMNNPVDNGDGTVTIQMITGFRGVISSSELSCDVVCHIMFITYDPVTGGRLKTSEGCKKDYDEAEDPDFQDCPFCYRRFYFIKGDSDPQGEFTVTGCTFASYTSPDSMVSTDNMEANIIPSLPKIWEQTNKSAGIFNVGALERNIRNIAIEAGRGLADIGIMIITSEIAGKLGGKVGARTGAVANLGAGVGAGMFTSMWLDEKITSLANSTINPSEINNAISTVVTGSKDKGYAVVSNNNWWTVYHGPVYEQSIGYTPQINFCEKRIIGNDYCTHKYVVRNMVNKYHAEQIMKHIKQITDIEPRGKDACYYKFKEVDYNPNTNIEESIQMDKEIILKHTISDYITCTYTPTSFASDITNYPIRSYIDPVTFGTDTPRIIYPTRNTFYTSDLIARFVRVRPPLGGNGFLNLAQIAVFDVSGLNISTYQPTYATSTSEYSSNSDSVVNGTTSIANDLVSVWQSATNALTEYWEVDLGKNMNISEIVYFGANIVTGRNQGVRIEFLYTNATDEIPIFTYTLAKDDAVQYIPLYSSSYTKPIYPISGSITIPRPIGNNQKAILGENQGCVNRCENKNIIDSLIFQYNTQATSQATGQQIVKILRGATVNTNTCEYFAEVLVQDTPTTNTMGSKVTGKRSMVKQYLSMSITPTVQGYAGLVFARYIKIIPSFKEGTVLEISKVLVWSSAPIPNTQDKGPGLVVSQGKGLEGNIYPWNQLIELDEIYNTKKKTNPTLGKFDFITDGSTNAQIWPNIYVARNNHPDTEFVIDLGTNSSDPCPGVYGKNYEIYQIQFVGRLDRDPGGIKDIRIELYADAPGDQTDAFSGKYAPTFIHNLPTDDTTQTIKVSSPALCTFTLQGTEVLEGPQFLQPNVPDFSTTDTSGGVFFFSGMVDSIRNAWESITKLSTSDMVSPIMDNVAVSNQIVGSMLDTVSATQKISGTNNTCKDPEVLKGFMTAYALSRGPAHTDEFGVITHIMNRILKAGPSSPTTCDVLFEDIYAMYDDYVVDIKDKDNKGTEIKAVRFKMNALDNKAIPAQDAPGSTESVNIVDLSANAIGLLASSSTLSPVFTGPGYVANCTDPAILRTIKAQFESPPPQVTATGTSLTANRVTQTFQSTPLSCEYAMVKTKTTINRIDNTQTTWPNINTYIKAVFNLGSDGRTVTLESVTEYDPALVTYSSDYMHTYINGAEVSLPSLVSYNPGKYGVSTRVNTTVYNM